MYAQLGVRPFRLLSPHYLYVTIAKYTCLAGLKMAQCDQRPIYIHIGFPLTKRELISNHHMLNTKVASALDIIIGFYAQKQERQAPKPIRTRTKAASALAITIAITHTYVHERGKAHPVDSDRCCEDMVASESASDCAPSGSAFLVRGERPNFLTVDLIVFRIDPLRVLRTGTGPRVPSSVMCRRKSWLVSVSVSRGDLAPEISLSLDSKSAGSPPPPSRGLRHVAAFPMLVCSAQSLAYRAPRFAREPTSTRSVPRGRCPCRCPSRALFGEARAEESEG